MRKTTIGFAALLVSLTVAGCASRNDSTQPQADSKANSTDTPTSITASGVKYGGEMKLKDADTIPVAKLVGDLKSYEGKWVRVSAVVTEVCQPKGCWMRIAAKTGSESVFVKFTCPIDGRLIPVEAVGKPTVVEGTVKLREISEEQARHYAKDAGKSDAEIEKIKGPQTELRLWDAIAAIEGVKPS